MDSTPPANQRESIMGRIDKRIAVVTGAATGIGAATAKLFAEEGATVLCADVDEDEIERTVSNI